VSHAVENADAPAPDDAVEPAKDKSPRPRRRSRWRIAGTILLALVVLLLAARLALPTAVRWYVNRTINRSEMYEGRIGEIHLHLWRGAYEIDDVRLLKTTGNVPVPLFSAKRVDFAMQWDAVLHRRLVGQMVMFEPELNFVDSGSDSDSQTGAGGPWLQIIRDLFPFKINSARIRNGQIHFRAVHRDPPVDVYLSQLDASVENLTNIHDDVAPLVTTIAARAKAMNQADFQYEMKLDPFSYRPTFQLAVRLLGLDVTKTNELARAYGNFDFERGWFDLVIEMEAKEGQVQGYVKPLFRDLQVFSLKRDVAKDNPLQLFWEALVGVTTDILKNPPRDQFGTMIPFRGDMTGPQTDLLAAVGNVLRNAFIRAYLPRLEGAAPDIDDLRFDPGQITDASNVASQR
jgi:hypothetical protein